MFGEVIGTVSVAFDPENGELALVNTIADPVETHVDCLGMFLFFCLTVSVAIFPLAVLLSVTMGVAGWR